MIRLSVIILLFNIMLMGCSGEERQKPTDQAEEPKVTDSSNETERDSESTYKIQFEREQSFGSTKDVIIGEIATFTVDGSNRVYIADGDQTTIHVFNSDGSYNTSLGQQGKGPGEFTAMSPYTTTMEIHSNRLYVTDVIEAYHQFPHRVQVFLLNDLSFSHTMKMLAENKSDFKELKKYSPSRLYSTGDGMFLVAYRRSPNEYQDSLSFIRYVIQDSTGNIVSEPIMEQEDDIYLTSKVSYGVTALKFPFYGESLLAISGDDHLYSARTEQFKIHIYDIEGEHIRTFQQPFNYRTLTRSELINRYEKKADNPQSVALKMIREAGNLPETWPALETMLIDDENRLWVATIVDDMQIYEWWVLKKSGEVITKFEWPRDEPIEIVRNGYMYTRKTEEETGLQEIIRDQIEMN